MSTAPAPVDKVGPAAAARRLVRGALKGALGTLERHTGHPYASLVTVATDATGRPVVLISRLAVHTQNLVADARASLLFDGTSTTGDPLAGGRVTLVGSARPVEDGAVRRRFLSRHPAAEMYVDFPDFGFYVLEPATAHYVGGFGRIVDLRPADLLLTADASARVAEAEPAIVAHMNADHADAVALYAVQLLGAPAGSAWRMTGIDPEGFDLAGEAGALRLNFEGVVTTPGEVRKELARLADLARATAASGGSEA